jgi:acyl-coenzyme A synthetase/AMP-(fatty) acid ligase
LRVVLSTGSPLLPEDFEYVYDKVKADVLLASISGGTDICSCFALGNPLLPVRQSELQAFGLWVWTFARSIATQNSPSRRVKKANWPVAHPSLRRLFAFLVTMKNRASTAGPTLTKTATTAFGITGI